MVYHFHRFEKRFEFARYVHAKTTVKFAPHKFCRFNSGSYVYSELCVSLGGVAFTVAQVCLPQVILFQGFRYDGGSVLYVPYHLVVVVRLCRREVARELQFLVRYILFLCNQLIPHHRLRNHLSWRGT